LISIGLFVDGKSLCYLNCVCKRFSDVFSAGVLWRNLTTEFEDPSPLSHYSNWKYYYLFQKRMCYNWKNGYCKLVLHKKLSRTPIWHISMSEVSSIFAFGHRVLDVYDFDDQEFIYKRDGNNRYVWGTFIDENDNVYSGSKDDCFRIWTKTGTPVAEVAGNLSYVWCIHKHKNIIAAGSEHVFLWDATTYTLIRKLVVNAIVSSVYLDDNKIVCGTYANNVIVWDTKNYDRKVLTGHTEHVRCISVWNNSVVSASDDGTVKIWDIPTSKCLRTLLHSDMVFSVCSDKYKIISASNDGTVCVWLRDGTPLYRLIISIPCSVKFDKTRLVVGDRKGELRVYSFDVDKRESPEELDIPKITCT